MSEYNVYCDESCHLKNDHNNVMGFGCVCVSFAQTRGISLKLKSLKREFGCTQELKWTKVSPKNMDFYKALIDFFFEEKNLSFRALVVENKGLLNHDRYNNGSHDEFYYKMYFDLLKNVVEIRNSGDSFNFYFDIKDTLGTMRLNTYSQTLPGRLPSEHLRQLNYQLTCLASYS